MPAWSPVGLLLRWMGSVRVGGVGAPEDGFISYYAGGGNGEVSVMG